MTKDANATTRSVIVERVFRYPPQKIWRALTEGHLIAEWLMQNDFEPVVGRKFNFRAPAQPHWNGVTDCEVLAVEPHKRLSYTWNSSGEEEASGVNTIVTWTLTPVSGGTRLRMEQSGFRPDQDFNYQGAIHGWQRFIAALERVLDALAS